MLLYTARSSLSKALYLLSAALSFWEKNPNGCQACPAFLCCSTAPTWEPEASVISARSAAGEG
jgi:hypothetical protein